MRVSPGSKTMSPSRQAAMSNPALPDVLRAGSLAFGLSSFIGKEFISYPHFVLPIDENIARMVYPRHLTGIPSIKQAGIVFINGDYGVILTFFFNESVYIA